MTAGAGKDFIVEVDSDGAGTYVQVARMRSNGLTVNAEEIDITSMDDDQFKTLLSGAGIRSATLSMSGVLSDEAPIDVIRTALLDQILTRFRLTEINGQWLSYFKITSFEKTGEYNGAQLYSMSLSSSGPITFT